MAPIRFNERDYERAGVAVRLDNATGDALRKLALTIPVFPTSGYLLGECIDRVGDDRYQIMITHVLQAQFLMLSGGLVLPTVDTWAARDKALAELRRQTPQLSIRGWFMIKPGIGAELDEDNRRDHTGYFPHPSHIMLILDGIRRVSACYGWADDERVLVPVPAVPLWA